MKMTLSELVEHTRRLQRMLDVRAGRRWTVDAYVVELLSQVTQLADSVMAQEGYRRLPPGQKPPDLSADLAAMMFLLVGIAANYEVDIEAAYRDFLLAAGPRSPQLAAEARPAADA